MKDNLSVLESGLQYAVSMVRSGCATPEQAAKACGIPLSDLRARLSDKPKEGTTAKAKLFRSFNT